MSADALALLAGDLVLVGDDRLLRVLEAAAVVVHRVIEQRHLLSELLRGLEIEIVLETEFSLIDYLISPDWKKKAAGAASEHFIDHLYCLMFQIL